MVNQIGEASPRLHAINRSRSPGKRGFTWEKTFIVRRKNWFAIKLAEFGFASRTAWSMRRERIDANDNQSMTDQNERQFPKEI